MKIALGRHARRLTLFALAVTATAAAGCGDSTGPDDDVNPALAAAANESDFGASGGSGLPQGAAPFTGPGGMAMDATAEEFVQQATLKNGTVWKTSGIKVVAVPDEAVEDPAFMTVFFGAAFVGSLDSVEPGTYEAVTEFPQIDFVTPMKFGFARVREQLRGPVQLSDEGAVTIRAVNFFPDVYTCELPENPMFEFESCTYQIGVLSGAIEFTATIQDGAVTVEQQKTDFTLPIRRRTIIMHEK